MKVNHTIDMLHGPIAGPMFLFALPLALTGILQQLFNTADVLVLGQYVGTNALAAVGNNSPIIGLLVNLFMGVSLGANVVIARFIGAHNLKETTRAVHTSFLLALILGFAVAVAGELMAEPMLRALSVPEEVMEPAALYLRIYLLGMPAIGLYNFESAIYRSRGDTQTPLKALAVASLLNIAGNLAAVLLLDWGIAGVAAATSLANYVSAWMLYHNLCHEHGIIRIEPGAIRMIGPYAREILRIGLPAGIQGMVFSLSNLVIQAAINSLGAEVMAASAAAFIIEINIYVFLIAFGQSITTFVSQNYGAGNLPRCRQVTRVGMQVGMVVIVLLSGSACLLADHLLAFFNDVASIIEIGRIRVFYIVGFYAVCVFIEGFSGAMRGYGYSLPPALLMLATVCGVRIVWIYTVFAAEPTFRNIMVCYPISWTITAVLLAGIYGFYRKNIKVIRV
ncbi:putative efflux protein, MATE family [Selenomonas ruminantium]|uniref:Probable multidrug resistance protein NorM n=1 Tax=Selenomonas ruminantium TaxID=971 RepID=A0A1I3FJK6_SELRU|nr:MATE family efflux transporter [Selenomonas ruminantium]SFI11302.1 putative efflux protein, MATE family [Selenomonas ruminantium]